VIAGRDRKLWVAMAITTLAVTAWCVPGAWMRATYGARTTADEPQYLLTAMSLGEDGDLDIADERAAGRYRDFHEVGLPIQERVRDDGARVSPHDPLLPLVLAVPMLVGGWLAAKLTLALLAGLLAAAMLWLAVVRFRVSLRVAVLTVLAFGLAAPLAIYATQVYPELPAALAVTIGVGALLGAPSRSTAAVLTAAVVALPWLSVKYVFVGAALLAVAAFRWWRLGARRHVVVTVSLVGVAAVLFVVVHQVLYDGWTAYASGRHFAGGEMTVVGETPDYLGRSVRLAGLLDDRNFGLLTWQPAFLLAVPALAALVWRRPAGWTALAVPLAVGWANATFVALTMHGWWWPGRQVVVVVPCVVVAIAWWAQVYRPARALVAIGGVVGACTAAWLTADVLTGHMTLIFDFARTTNPVVRAWRFLAPDGIAGGSTTDAVRVAWLGAFAALAAWGVHTVRARHAPRRSTPARRRPSVMIHSRGRATA
jgi:hypothetical protein